jgi:hypothetical protein
MTVVEFAHGRTSAGSQNSWRETSADPKGARRRYQSDSPVSPWPPKYRYEYSVSLGLQTRKGCEGARRRAGTRRREPWLFATGDSPPARRRGPPWRAPASTSRPLRIQGEPTEREQQPEREKSGRQEIESELPRERVHRPQSDECGEPRTPPCPQGPNRCNRDEFEQDHDERMGRPRRAAPEQGVESKEKHGSGRVLRVGVVAVEQCVSPAAVQHGRVDAVHSEVEVEPDPSELEREGHEQQWDKAEPVLLAPGDDKRRQRSCRANEDPRRRASLDGCILRKKHYDHRASEHEMRLADRRPRRVPPLTTRREVGQLGPAPQRHETVEGVSSCTGRRSSPSTACSPSGLRPTMRETRYSGRSRDCS